MIQRLKYDLKKYDKKMKKNSSNNQTKVENYKCNIYSYVSTTK